MPQQANSYGWVPLARAVAVKRWLIGGRRAAAVVVAVVGSVVVFGAESVKLLSMYCLLTGM